MNCTCGRRHLLLGGAAAALFSPSASQAVNKPRRIDVHHHIVPPAWLEALKASKQSNPIIEGWTPAKSLDDMDKAGITTAMVSPTTPQVGFLPAADAARVARASNEWAVKLASDHPGRFGVFAMLPMPYADESLKEIAYAFDTLKVDGIGMMTNYGDKWLGYDEFAPVFQELNRRKAVVYTHPTGANCCVNLVKGGVRRGRGVWCRHHPYHYKFDLQRSVDEVRRYELHLLPRWRRVGGGGGAVAYPNGYDATIQRQVHP